MTNYTAPNDWMSNAAVLLLVPLVTATVMRVKNNMCTSRPRLRTKYAVDLANMIATNLLALASILLWCHELDVSLASVVAVDVLLGIQVERWLVSVIVSLDSTCYHPGGPLGKSMIYQRMRISSAIATIIRGYIVACRLCVVMHSPHLDYSTDVFVIPAMYTAVRTIALDIDVYKPGIARVELPTEDSNMFCIASDDEDNGEQLTDEEAVQSDDITAL